MREEAFLSNDVIFQRVREGTEKRYENFGQDSQCFRWNLNPKIPKHETGLGFNVWYDVVW
jgi:hypothetical protein